MHDVQMYAGAIRVLLYGVCVCLGDISLAKAREYLPVHIHKPSKCISVNKSGTASQE